MLIPSLVMSSLLTVASPAFVNDFCVADFSQPTNPDGFACKDTKEVTVADFSYSGLNTRGNTTNLQKIALTPASTQQVPGLNGLFISMGRLDMDEGGVLPIHSHPDGSELEYVIQGTITAGFISATNNSVYLTTLNDGDMMVFPQGLLHFQTNSGKGPAILINIFNTATPGVQFIQTALFGNNLTTGLVAALTQLDVAEVKKLKGVLGGSG